MRHSSVILLRRTGSGEIETIEIPDAQHVEVEYGNAAHGEIEIIGWVPMLYRPTPGDEASHRVARLGWISGTVGIFGWYVRHREEGE